MAPSPRKPRSRTSSEPVRPAAASPPWPLIAVVAAIAVPLVPAFAYLSRAVAAHGRIAFPMDDPYIHFQFARNLAEGAGFSFNPGEPTPGATSPLWVVMLALARLLGAPLEASALVLGTAAASATGWLTFSIGRACRLPVALALAAAIAAVAAGRFTWASLSGMETTMAAALSLAVLRVHLVAGGSPWRTVGLGLLCGLAAQARPEMMLLFPIVAVLEWRRSDTPETSTAQRLRALGMLAAAFAVVALPYVVFCLATTGRPLPNTFYAKSLLPLQHSGSALMGLRFSYLPELLRWTWLDNALVAVLVIPGAWLWMRRRGANALALLWPLAFCVYALALYPRHFSLSRYTIPLIPFFALLAMGAADALIARLSRPRFSAWAGLAVVVLVVASTAWRHSDFRKIYLANVSNIVAMHVAMAEWVDAELPVDARIAANDIGAITYYSGRYCIDTVGLVSSELITRQIDAAAPDASAHEAVLADYLEQAEPDFAVLFPVWYPHLVRQPWLDPIHQIRHTNTTGGGDQMVVFRVVGTPRRPAPDRRP